jgi:hypothetical protein
MEEAPFGNIRNILGKIIGTRVVDITQHDKDEFAETGESFIQFHFDDGSYVKFPIGPDGFHHNCDEDRDADADPGYSR